MKVQTNSHAPAYELPEKLMPFTKTVVNEINGKSYVYVTNAEYAAALARRVPPTAGDRQTNPLKYSWQVVE